VVRGTFSPARAWRPAVVTRLARTLGLAESNLQCARRISAFGVNKTATKGYPPRRTSSMQPVRLAISIANRPRVNPDLSTQVLKPARKPQGSRSNEPQAQLEAPALLLPSTNLLGSSLRRVSSAVRSPTSNETSTGTISQGRDEEVSKIVATTFSSRLGTSSKSSSAVHRQSLRRAARPNHSLKRSANGRPPGPGWWYAVHFHQPGPGVLPLSPA
jgi:hypothetical protein